MIRKTLSKNYEQERFVRDVSKFTYINSEFEGPPGLTAKHSV